MDRASTAESLKDFTNWNSERRAVVQSKDAIEGGLRADPENGRRERLRRGRMGDLRVQSGEGFPSFSTIEDSPQSVKSSKSSKKSKDDGEKADLSSYVDNVQKVMEGLRGEKVF